MSQINPFYRKFVFFIFQIDRSFDQTRVLRISFISGIRNVSKKAIRNFVIPRVYERDNTVCQFSFRHSFVADIQEYAIVDYIISVPSVLPALTIAHDFYCASDVIAQLNIPDVQIAACSTFRSHLQERLPRWILIGCPEYCMSSLRIPCNSRSVFWITIRPNRRVIAISAFIREHSHFDVGVQFQSTQQIISPCKRCQGIFFSAVVRIFAQGGDIKNVFIAAFVPCLHCGSGHGILTGEKKHQRSDYCCIKFHFFLLLSDNKQPYHACPYYSIFPSSLKSARIW